MTRLTHLLSLALAVTSASAFWRLQCFGVVARGRIDPIVNPGEVSGHVHAVHGGSGFSNGATADDLLKSDCTSCQVEADRSAYWEPQLYFFHKNGSVSVVEETAGHLTYYKYTPCYTSKGVLKQPEPMPNGLRMISGNPFRRNFTLPVPDPPLPWTGEHATQDALQQKAIGFNCLNYNKAPEPSLYRHFMPDKKYLADACPDGLRVEVLFPYCWDGELDSADHKSHLAFPDANLNGGKCPPGYDRVINQLFFETIYPVQNFAKEDGYFAFAQGDPTGYGFHGDVLIAWKDDQLKKATELCGPLSGPDASGVITDCPIFKVLDPSQQSQCKIPKGNSMTPDENVMYDLQKLPGNNPLQYGPEEASKKPSGGNGSGSGSSGSSSSLSASKSTAKPSPSLPPATATTAPFTDALGNQYKQKPKPTGTGAAGLGPQFLENGGGGSASADAPKTTAKPKDANGAEPSDGKVLTTIWEHSHGTAIGKVVIEKVVYVTKIPPGAEEKKTEEDEGKKEENKVHQRAAAKHLHEHHKRMGHSHGHHF